MLLKKNNNFEIISVDHSFKRLKNFLVRQITKTVLTIRYIKSFYLQFSSLTKANVYLKIKLEFKNNLYSFFSWFCYITKLKKFGTTIKTVSNTLSEVTWIAVKLRNRAGGIKDYFVLSIQTVVCRLCCNSRMTYNKFVIVLYQINKILIEK